MGRKSHTWAPLSTLQKFPTVYLQVNRAINGKEYNALLMCILYNMFDVLKFIDSFCSFRLYIPPSNIFTSVPNDSLNFYDRYVNLLHSLILLYHYLIVSSIRGFRIKVYVRDVAVPVT